MTTRAYEKRPGILGMLDLITFKIALLAEQISTLICAFLIAATTTAVAAYQVGISIPWLDDLLRLLLVWLVYMACVPLCLRNDHISMDAVYMRMPAPVRKVVDVVVTLMGIGLCGYVTKIGYVSLVQSYKSHDLVPSGYFASWPQSLAIPVGFGLMTIAYVSFLFSIFTGRRRGHSGDGADESEHP